MLYCFSSRHLLNSSAFRFLGIIEKPFAAFNWDHFSAVDPEATAIPRHRIQYFKYGEKILWDRRNRRDLIFGSGIVQEGKQRNLDDIISKENAKLGYVPADDDDEEFADVDNDESDEWINHKPSSMGDELPLDEKEECEGFEDIPAGVRPNFYLSIPIKSEELKERIEDAQDTIKSQFPRIVRYVF